MTAISPSYRIIPNEYSACPRSNVTILINNTIRLPLCRICPVTVAGTRSPFRKVHYLRDMPKFESKGTVSPFRKVHYSRDMPTSHTHANKSNITPAAPAKSRTAGDMGNDIVGHDPCTYGTPHILLSTAVALLIGCMTYATFNADDTWGVAALSGWLTNELLATHTMQKIIVRLVDRTPGANTSTSKCACCPVHVLHNRRRADYCSKFSRPHVLPLVVALCPRRRAQIRDL